MKKSYFKTIAIAIILISLMISMILFPKETYSAAERGLNMWWGIVFPSLLPFLVIGELLGSFGIVAFLGVLLEPIMRPIFRVPGVGGFVMALGMVSGFPAGAKMTANLRKQEQLTKVEAERLVGFTNTANPLFIFGAIAIGFFHEPRIGIILAIAHYGGNLLVGFLMRFHGRNNHRTAQQIKTKVTLSSAINAMHQTRVRETRAFGKIFADAVSSAVQTLLMIGGFIIIFSVLNKILFEIGSTNLISQVLQLFLPDSLTNSIVAGFFEMTLGIQLASSAKAPMLLTMILVSVILGFAGLSIHAQVASILAETDISYKPFLLAKLLHATLAGSITYFLMIQTTWVENVFQRIQFPKVEMITYSKGPTFTLSILVLYAVFYGLQMIKKY